MPLSCLLVANRGEIAVRLLRAAAEFGLRTVAIYSEDDAQALHTRQADEARPLRGAGAAAYLDIEQIVALAQEAGCDAVHPGYGFLSENAHFADIVKAHKITFIGPQPDHIRLMGDKIAAKQAVKSLGIPTVPGSDGAIGSESEAASFAAEIGYPVLIKAAAGGGGRGMKVARSPSELPLAYATARSEAKAAFGDDAVYMEKYLERPRHIEIQVIADSQGKVLHLGERDCSLQRRHQKVWEEAPSPALNVAARNQIGAVVTSALEKLGYLGVGTVEFLYENGQFYFIEMNTRLQVEHPVTELVTGLDLVREQIRIADGGALELEQSDVVVAGHAIECRINAENPFTFQPSPGKITEFHAPGGLGVRMDSAAYSGYRIPPYYDSLVGKLIVHGKSRNECLMRLRRALDELVVGGIETTIPLFQELIKQPDILDGDYNIHWLEHYLARRATGAL